MKNDERPVCAVITPVGPGHEALAKEAQLSVEMASRIHPGPFSKVVFLSMPDLDGEQGRSRRRNDGIAYALANNIDWLFFLDADDVMTPDAFASVAPYVEQHDAVFGLIAEAPGDKPEQIRLRPRQLGPTRALADILKSDPFLSIQMGHFVRAKAANAVRFDVDMDTGEDFKYYLELWKQFRCAKIDRPLFVNRRGSHAAGPRAADGGEWRKAVGQVFGDFCSRHDLNISFPWKGKTVRLAMGNPMDLIHKSFMSGTFFEAKELDYLCEIIPPHSVIVEVGANVGNHLVYYGLFMEPARIIPIEPNPEAIALLRKNTELNGLANVDMSLLGFGAGEKHGHFDLVEPVTVNMGAVRLVASERGKIEVYPLDAKLKDKIDFLKIDVEHMEMDVLRGAGELISKSRPILFIEIRNENVDAFARWTEASGYKIIKVFPYVHFKNFVAVPSDHPLAQESVP